MACNSMVFGAGDWFWKIMNYSQLLKKIEQYKNKYNIKVIGKTLLGRKIFAVEKLLSEQFFTAIFIASVHARENITTDLLCRFLDEGLFDDIKNFNLSFILMSNPDGVELSSGGIFSVSDDLLRQNLLNMNLNNQDFSLWKANARGVDVNNNFDANFGQNVTNKSPASQGFCGECCESENETIALVKYTKSKKAFLSISYHSKGEEIYYNFFQKKKNLERDKLIAERFAKSTGYSIRNVENLSSGGYKDWCVQKLKIPSLTIEVGSDDLCHPITIENLDEIFEKHKKVAFDVEFAYNVYNRYCR